MKTSTWDETYITLCYLMATRSPDLSTKVGAVIVDTDNSLVSVGYNGLPRGVDVDYNDTDSVGVPKMLSTEGGSKYRWTEHSERNAIYNAGRHGKPVAGCRVYVNFLPCADCARAIIQSNITEVIVHQEGQDAFMETRGANPNVWTEDHLMVQDMFRLGGVHLRWCSTELVQISAFFSGQEVKL